MTHKEIATSFLIKVARGEVREAYDNHVAADFIHHKQYFQGDRQSLLDAMEEAHETSPNKSLEVRYCYQEGDRVITHSLVAKEDFDVAVIHVFRFANNKIAELWDLGQVIEKDSPNEHGLF